LCDDDDVTVIDCVANRCSWLLELSFWIVRYSVSGY